MHLILLVALARLSMPGTFSEALDLALDEAWREWKTTFPKEYHQGEEEYRRSVWEENMKMIEQHNQEYAEGKHTFEMAMNHFGDMTNEEFKHQMRGCYLDPDPLGDNETLYQTPIEEPLPEHVDWREEGHVTPVKNQGQCGSCWAFSATGALEALHARNTGELLSLSEQNLIDCSPFNTGCCGGWPHLAFQYVCNNKGINQEDNYPYEARKGPCRFNNEDRAVSCSGYMRFLKNEQFLQHAVATQGPVAAGMFMPLIQFYGRGILTSDHCDRTSLHAVLLVGYGTGKDDEDYWIIKNSWGEGWGNGGYALLERGTNACGISENAAIPI